MPRVIVCEEGGRVRVVRCFTLVEPFCEICLRTGHGEPEADWRVIEVDGEPHCFCPRHFPPAGAGVKRLSAAYRNCLEEIQSRRRLGYEVNCIEAIKQLASELPASNKGNLYEILTERFGDFRRTLELAARRRVVADTMEVAGLVAQMRLKLSAAQWEGAKWK
jgi:hypothetical protein